MRQLSIAGRLVQLLTAAGLSVGELREGEIATSSLEPLYRADPAYLIPSADLNLHDLHMNCDRVCKGARQLQQGGVGASRVRRLLIEEIIEHAVLDELRFHAANAHLLLYLICDLVGDALRACEDRQPVEAVLPLGRRVPGTAVDLHNALALEVDAMTAALMKAALGKRAISSLLRFVRECFRLQRGIERFVEVEGLAAGMLALHEVWWEVLSLALMLEKSRSDFERLWCSLAALSE